MPKYEIEPGRYGFKKPDPKTSKERTLRETINEELLEESESRASIRVAAEWMETRPRDFRTLENCDECLRSLTDTVWQATEHDEILEPAFKECSQHPGLVRDWVYDQLNEMFDYLEDRLNER